MIYGFIPWNDIWDNIFGAEFPLPTFRAFYFTQATVLFIVMSVVIGLVARLGEKGTVNAIVAGAADFLGAALIIVLARAVTVVMKNTYITDTILHWTENAVTGTTGGSSPRSPAGEHADRLPGAVVVRSRGARHADPRTVGRFRRRRPLARR